MRFSDFILDFGCIHSLLENSGLGGLLPDMIKKYKVKEGQPGDTDEYVEGGRFNNFAVYTCDYSNKFILFSEAIDHPNSVFCGAVYLENLVYNENNSTIRIEGLDIDFYSICSNTYYDLKNKKVFRLNYGEKKILRIKRFEQCAYL